MALRVGSPPETNVQDNLETWTAYDWSSKGDEWSNNFGGSGGLWYGLILPRIHRFLDVDHILEIAPGHGRCTQFLLRHARELTIVDLVPRCIEACRKRFHDDPRIHFVVNDGMSLPGTPDASVDFVFSWDSLVHAAREPVRAYIHEIARVLKPGGAAFLHHSNLGMQFPGMTPEQQQVAYGFRQPSVSHQSVASDCADAGLWCALQELIPQALPTVYNDCYSLLRKLPERRHEPTRVVKHDNWGKELALVRATAELYSL